MYMYVYISHKCVFTYMYMYYIFYIISSERLDTVHFQENITKFEKWSKYLCNYILKLQQNTKGALNNIILFYPLLGTEGEGVCKAKLLCKIIEEKGLLYLPLSGGCWYSLTCNLIGIIYVFSSHHLPFVHIFSYLLSVSKSHFVQFVYKNICGYI